MDIVRLEAGRIAPPETDCIRIEEQADGRFLLTGTALAPCGEDEALTSVSLVESEPYASYEAAEGAGLAWAELLEVAELHVSRSDGTTPLPDPT